MARFHSFLSRVPLQFVSNMPEQVRVRDAVSVASVWVSQLRDQKDEEGMCTEDG